MKIVEPIRIFLRNLSIELLAIWFAFRDDRVRWHKKLLLLVPIAYVVSPFDMLRDTTLFWGQVDDLVVLRVSYFLVMKFIDPLVLADCRTRSAEFLDASGMNRIKFAVAIILVWGFVIAVILQYFFRRFLRHA